jgi:hypothetical protein
MKQFEYDITLHPASAFKHVAVFCGQDGQCALEEVPDDQIRKLLETLNQRGQNGWELVQLAFNPNGLMAFWKRELLMD